MKKSCTYSNKKIQAKWNRAEAAMIQKHDQIRPSLGSKTELWRQRQREMGYRQSSRKLLMMCPRKQKLLNCASQENWTHRFIRMKEVKKQLEVRADRGHWGSQLPWLAKEVYYGPSSVSKLFNCWNFSAPPVSNA